jgi:hypothetical protein
MFSLYLRAAVAASLLAHASTASGPAFAAASEYKFEVAGPVTQAGKASVVPVKLVKEGKPVAGAVVFEAKADMGPMQMETMTAPVQRLPEGPAGTYKLQLEPGMAGKWALHLAAKVNGETETVRGDLVVDLKP